MIRIDFEIPPGTTAEEMRAAVQAYLAEKHPGAVATIREVEPSVAARSAGGWGLTYGRVVAATSVGRVVEVVTSWLPERVGTEMLLANVFTANSEGLRELPYGTPICFSEDLAPEASTLITWRQLSDDPDTTCFILRYSRELPAGDAT